MDSMTDECCQRFGDPPLINDWANIRNLKKEGRNDDLAIQLNKR